MSDHEQNQGEGDKHAARRYNQSGEQFVKSEEGREAVTQAGRDDQATQKKLRKAQREAASRAAETDPAVTRNYRDSDA